MIDPRGTFGEFDIYGDERYELAKILHSIEGKYDFIIKDLFKLETDDLNYRIEFNYTEPSPDIVSIFMNVFHEKINGIENQLILIESLLFLSMIPLHRESLKHQQAMLCRGIQLLDRVLDIRYRKELHK